MTSEEIAVMALSRAIEFSSKVPSARSVAYRRIGVRQQQLYTRAAKLNPEWSGVKATAATVLWEGLRALDLADLVDTPLDLITRIEVTAPGTSALLAGQEINIVTLADPGVADAPRVVVRNRVIQAYNNELDGVDTISVYYPHIPRSILATEGGVAVELYPPHDELLVIDLTRHLLQKTIALDAGSRTAAITALDAEETPMLEQFDEHVRRYSDATLSRFGGSRYAPGQS